MTAQSKGKVVVKSWQLLPPEIVRHIVTFALLDISATAFIPRVWERQDHWLPRMSYTVIRDAKLLEKYMSICSSWGRARKSCSSFCLRFKCAKLPTYPIASYHLFIFPSFFLLWNSSYGDHLVTSLSWYNDWLSTGNTCFLLFDTNRGAIHFVIMQLRRPRKENILPS